MAEKRIYCGALSKVTEVECCSSCHHEWDDGYYSEMEQEAGGVTLLGCCGALGATEDKTDEERARLFAAARRTYEEEMEA